jgi:hypothetical protein
MVFDLINKKHFNDTLTIDYDHPDMFSNNFTSPTEYDVKHYGIAWNEPVKKLEL